MARGRFRQFRTVPPNPLFRRTPLRWAAGAGILGILVGGAYVALVLWPRFSVNTVTVHASPSISAVRVEAFVRERLAGRVMGLPKSSQFLISTRSLERQLRLALAGTVAVETVQVRRQWPRVLQVTITETSGVFALTSGEAVLLLDAGGRIVNRLPAPGALFTLQDPMELPWGVGETVLPPATLAALTALRRELETVGIRTVGAQIPEVTCYPELPDANAAPTTSGGTADTPCDRKALVRLTTDLVLGTEEGWELEVIVTGDRSRQITDLTTLLAERFRTGRATLAFVDVRIPGRAYIRTR